MPSLTHLASLQWSNVTTLISSWGFPMGKRKIWSLQTLNNKRKSFMLSLFQLRILVWLCNSAESDEYLGSSTLDVQTAIGDFVDWASCMRCAYVFKIPCPGGDDFIMTLFVVSATDITDHLTDYGSITPWGCTTVSNISIWLWFWCWFWECWRKLVTLICSSLSSNLLIPPTKRDVFCSSSSSRPSKLS